VVCGALGIILAAYVAFQGVIFDYKGTDGTGRAFFGILGLSVLAVGIWGWRRLTQSPDADT